MVAGRRYWIAIWYGILFLGALGLWSSLYWGKQTHWKNLDELLRAIGTLMVSLGMLLLLNGVLPWLGQTFLLFSLISFAIAFVLGRNLPPPRDPDADDAADDYPEHGA